LIILSTGSEFEEQSRASMEESSLEKSWNGPSRFVVGLAASLGAAECAFITYSKYFQPDVFSNGALCQAAGGCGNVLTGPYSQIFGIPLTLPAMFVYGGVLACVLYPLFVKDQPERARVEGLTRPLILVLGTGLATFSTYLMGLLAFKLHAVCPYCFFSAFLSYTIAATVWGTKVVEQKTKAVVLGICSFLVTLLGSGLIFLYTEKALLIPQPQASTMAAIMTEEGPFSPPPIFSRSSQHASALSLQLKGLNAKMYGAFWCSHCHDQKEEFGREAFANIEYIECSPKGLNSQRDQCQQKEIPGYPTWEINGQYYPGQKSLDSLEQIVRNIMASSVESLPSQMENI